MTEPAITPSTVPATTPPATTPPATRPSTVPAATTIDTRYSDAEAPLPWDRAVELLTAAELYWLTTVRADGRPHVTPLIGLWHDGAFVFCTGTEEQKAHNLRAAPNVVVTTGTNTWAAGTDIVLEGVAEPITQRDLLQEIADDFLATYGPSWKFELHEEGGFHAGGAERGGLAQVFRVLASTAFAFTKDPHGQTRYRFGQG